MNKTILSLIILLGISGVSESKTLYSDIQKYALLKQRHMIDNEPYFKVLLKPNVSNIKCNDVVIRIVRGNVVLKELRPTIRVIDESSVEPSYPWEILMPADEKHSENGSEVETNLEPGSLSWLIGYGVTGNIFSGVKEIKND